MDQLSVVGATPEAAEALRAAVGNLFESKAVLLSELRASSPARFNVVDLDLTQIANVPPLRDWMLRKPLGAKVVFITDKEVPLQSTRALAIGATDVLHRPVESQDLVGKLLGGVAALSADPSNEAIKKSPGVAAAVGSLQNVFSSASLGTAVNTPAVSSASETVVGQVETQGLNAWIEIVRKHHSLTYQHCLLVTGLAVAFGQQIGVSRTDRRRLSMAAMLHDIGKARIPLAILEKAGPLDADEQALMKKHAELGHEVLKSTPGMAPEMLDMVLHHHELLDGSGYPHGLGAQEIPDLVRMITIADVFGALIEWRSYKEPMPNHAAFQVLLDMGPKLDQDLVRAFEPVAHFGAKQRSRS